MAITDEEVRMTIKTLPSKGLTKRAIAQQLSLSEGTVRHHLRRIAAKAADVPDLHPQQHPQQDRDVADAG